MWDQNHRNWDMNPSQSNLCYEVLSIRLASAPERDVIVRGPAPLFSLKCLNKSCGFGIQDLECRDDKCVSKRSIISACAEYALETLPQLTKPP